MLVQRHRRWGNINPALAQRLVFARIGPTRGNGHCIEEEIFLPTLLYSLVDLNCGPGSCFQASCF